MSAIALRAGLAPPYRKGWCPGASGRWRPETDCSRGCGRREGDCRSIRPPRWRTPLALRQRRDRPLGARQSSPARFDRANAARPACAPQAAALIDADSEVERLRNIVASPLDDIDPEASFDLGPSFAALERRLGEDERLRGLPAKFSFLLDAQGRLPLGDIDADIRFEASRGGTFGVFLAGENALAAECAPDESGDVAARLGGAFLALAGAGEAAPRRMRALVERDGAEAIFAEAGCEAKPRRRSPGRASLRDLLGVQVFGAAVTVGAAAAFGAIDAGRFNALIERARMLGASGLRLTPWRAFLIAGLDSRRRRVDARLDR